MKNILAILVAVAFLACSKDENTTIEMPEDDVISNAKIFQSVSTGNYSILNAVISGDALHITLNASGCDGNNWKMQLVDAKEISKTSPRQRKLKVALDNQEDCAAMVTKEKSFDLRSLRVAGTNKVRFSLAGWDKQLEYTY